MASPSTGSPPQVSISGPLAALDPGRSKCGLVLSDPQRRDIQQALIQPPEICWQTLQTWQRQGNLAAVVIGDGTGSAAWQRRLAPLLPVIVVPEHGTTLAARVRYWQLEPARGWRRLLPEGLRQPPRDWDDVVAQLLLERWLGHPLSRDQNLARTVKT
jgi:hypothetical protein